MEAWSVHHLSQQAILSLGKPAAENLKAYALRLQRVDLPVVFTLYHLSKIVRVEYSLLRKSVERRREAANYRMFAIKKRSGGRRHIHQVTGGLFKAQQFVNAEILQKLKPHRASFAFHAEGGVYECAAMHCGARWLFQYDLKDFFYSINEASVYKVFVNAGYRPLLAFELARLCTTTRLPTHLQDYLYRRNKFFRDNYNSLCTMKNRNPVSFEGGELDDKCFFVDADESLDTSIMDFDLSVSSGFYKYKFYSEVRGATGVLPQGAPSSPMLSNMVAAGLDEALTKFSDLHGFIYTRYADDITLSVGGDFPDGLSVGKIHREVIHTIRKNGFIENTKKTRVAGPGSKKVVLGLLIDGAKPRLSKDTYKRIDRLLHATRKFGVIDTASHEGFDTPIGFYNHLAGLIAFVKDVDLARWNEFHQQFSIIPAPMNEEIKVSLCKS